MKKILAFILLLICMILVFISCRKQAPVVPESPIEVIKFKSMLAGDYNSNKG